MSSEPITFPNANYGASINPGMGAFTAQMLVAALGFGFANGGSSPIGVAVDIGAIAAPDYRPSNNPSEWLWKPDTVQPYMTGAAAATARSAVLAAYTNGKATR
jgi:hypothetical protein